MKRTKRTQDIISDTLTRMRNAISSGRETVFVNNTKSVLELLKVLHNSNFISGYEIGDDNNLNIFLKVDGEYKFSSLERVSKQSIRRYVKASEIKPVKGGRGLAIISTSSGVKSGIQAKKENLGGEYICKIW